MVRYMVFPVTISVPAPAAIFPHPVTAVGVMVGDGEGVTVFVTVGDSVEVGGRLGVDVTIGVEVNVLVGVLEGVNVGVTGGVGVLVGVEACHVEGGRVTTIGTLTRTVRALCASMGRPLSTERSMKPTILGTIGL